MSIPLPHDGDESDNRFPLGKPIPKGVDTQPEWLPYGNTPGVQRNRITGKMRNVAPTPAEPAVQPWYTFTPIEDPYDGFMPE